MKKLLLSLGLLLAMSASAFALQVNLAWDAVTTYVGGSTIPAGTTVFYDVYRATLSNLSNAVKLNPAGVTAITYSDATVASGNTYYYFVKAYTNPALPSGNSNVVSVILLTPNSPTGLSGIVVP